ncbi:Na Pi-cotransporter II-related [Chlorella sorokiniana]|uniref:Na Pi-cotransporter II-related n=1 Tax=Chlorella sorokiniana TaxID=3076 RepID=A0A2P6TP72_CHLSO|nr:Na Pi-cotransporter II-related [Chlorella sorokiniana]|eukprot:PRW51130.1 Na Pi-cotransporter II-related [Chlorella sorokiniana]
MPSQQEREQEQSMSFDDSFPVERFKLSPEVEEMLEWFKQFEPAAEPSIEALQESCARTKAAIAQEEVANKISPEVGEAWRAELAASKVNLLAELNEQEQLAVELARTEAAIAAPAAEARKLLAKARELVHMQSQREDLQEMTAHYADMYARHLSELRTKYEEAWRETRALMSLVGPPPPRARR